MENFSVINLLNDFSNFLKIILSNSMRFDIFQGKLTIFIHHSVQRLVIVRTIIFNAFLMLSHQNLMKFPIKAWRVIISQGLSGLFRAFRQFIDSSFNYSRWIALYDTLNDNDHKAINFHISCMKWQPLISIIMPTYNTPERWLRSAIESVRSQIYPNWELCVADDASTSEKVHSILEEYAQLDNRIRVIYRKKNGHISAASNTALDIAQGEFIALLDHDDELSPHALYMIAVALNEKSYLDLIYSDEDKIDENGRRFDPYFKPDWNPALLTGQNVVSHLGVFRTELVRSTGGFREGYEGSQDWDLALRFSELIPAFHIHHLPHVLYHWRAIAGSTSIGHNEKSYAAQAANKALCDHLIRTGCEGVATSAVGGYFRIQYKVPSPEPLVSIIIPTRNGLHHLRRCIESIKQKTLYSNYEILIVDNQSDDSETINYMKLLECAGIARILRYDLPFNYSAINNFAAQSAKGDYICLMNNDIEVISPDWLDEMLGHASRPEIGAVGAMLYFPNNTIQHAGVILGMGGVAGHIYAGHPRGTHGYMGRAALPQNLSAVSAACLLLRTSIYKEVGGLNEKNLPVAFNDVDFCLRIEDRGYRNLWTPFAEFYHHESASRGYNDTIKKKLQFKRDCDYMRSQWAFRISNDPYYNPNLTLNNSWPYVSSIRRATKPWQD